MRIAVLISGGGTNLQALIDYTFTNPVSIGLVLADSFDKAEQGLKRSMKAKIPSQVVDYKNHETREDAEKEITKILTEYNIDLVVLAGFMKILTPQFVNKWKSKLINLHPSLLPAFPGKTSIKDAFDYGVKVTGVTVHYVDEGTDTGQIIEQMACKIEDDWSLEELEQQIHNMEHYILSRVVDNLANKNIDI